MNKLVKKIHQISLKLSFSILIALTFCSFASSNDIAIITHHDSPVTKMTKQQLSDLYLGRKRAIDKYYLKLFDQQNKGDTQKEFYLRLTGMPLSRVNAYWARLRFSGRILPPEKLLDNDEVIKMVSSNKNAIGYISASSVNNSIKVIHWLK